MKVEIGINEAEQRIDKFLRKWLKDMPLSGIYRSIRKGDIRVNGKKVKEKYFLCEGDIVETKHILTENRKRIFTRIDNDFLKITYEDKNMIIVEKWPGVLVHSDKKKGENTLTDYVLSYLYDKGDYNPEQEITFTPAPCNRLDRNTSGVVIYGKNFESIKLLNEMIRERRIKKYYEALVKGRLRDGIYRAYIMKNEDQNISKIFDTPRKGAKEIAMQVKTLSTCGTYSLLELELITGRSHQLRAHLSYLKNPIVGDIKYGISKLNSFFYNKYGLDYQFLYAYKLTFKDCPEKLSYLENKTLAESLPPMLKKIKNDIFEKF
ncbi:RluA family pseudouridine synthase [Clostridium fermenticellae]|uniref:RNA pseudouridylate synthase n=1 Tax=Clostridium fermenticellae TaxID=2068654 RepID=A0A386H3N7_9CLOT|nr:RluA family pseudouridine synthase [Clostridium fermenticellae]AYD40264.1 RluA family pseudouridine synthase [Clostridium fermenticellae]